METINPIYGAIQTTENIADVSTTYLFNEYPRGLLYGVRSIQSSSLYTDVTLEVEGTSFRAHRIILGASSVYFRVMFSHECQESLSDLIKFPDTSPTTMKTVLDFIYTGKVEISENSVKDILKLAHLMELHFLIEACHLYLNSNLTCENAVTTMHSSKIYGFKDLADSSITYIINNFNKLQKKEILMLTSSELIEIISDEELHVFQEDEVFSVVVNWLQFTKEENFNIIFQLIGAVRMSKFSLKYIKKLTEIKLPVAVNKSFIEIMPYFKTLHKKERSYKLPGLYLVGGIGSEEYLVKLNLENGNPIEFRRSIKPRHSHGCAIVNRKLYIIGGSETTEVIRLNTVKKRSLTCSPLSCERKSPAVIELGGMIYACGGYVGNSISKTVERYDPSLDKWTEVASMITPRYNACSAVVDGCIYIICGEGENGFLRSCEYYDPEKDSWQKCTAMPFTLSHASAVGYQNDLFVIGGKKDGDAIDNNMKYGIDTKKWYTCRRIPYKVYSHIACTINGKIYVVGGKNMETQQLPLAIFDIASSTWTKKETIQLNISSFAGCFDI